MTQQRLDNEYDMLQGNINRLMVTDDMEELSEMYDWACKRVKRIYIDRYGKLRREQVDESH